jgi:uncharacterized protein (TIGR01777 family)
MKILISGSHGLLGSALVPFLQNSGHQVERLVRREGWGIQWDPESGFIDRSGLEDFDAVIHLAGENLSSGVWTAKKKARILSSRVKGTSLLTDTLTRLNRPPKVFISASAIGYYGDRGAELLDETSAPGNSFLARVCRKWEKATWPAVQAGIRVISLRSGLILSTRGGILPRLILATKTGTGAILGSGEQYQPWIALDDILSAIEHILIKQELSGPVNLVSLHTVSNYELIKTLGRVLRRPILFSIPAFLLGLIPGNMARELLLASARVVPKKLTTGGFIFKFPQLETALRSVLIRKV